MGANKMREEFEAAYVAEMVRQHGEGFRSSAVHSIKMDSPMVEIALWAWKASRESLAIDLPTPWETASGRDVMCAEDVFEAIKGAGLKVEP
jgi:hypothetical protein